MTARPERFAGAAAQGRAIEISNILRAGYATPGQRWSAATVRDMLDQPGTVALLDDGGCAIIRVAADEAELLTIAVTPAMRRRGAGTALLSGAVEAARARAATQLYLEVAADNAPALALYRRAGFAQVGRRRGYYARARHRVDALVMRLELAPR